MTSRTSRRVIVPIAHEPDAQMTCDAVDAYLDGEARIHILHVVEKAGGAPDKAPREAREEQAENIFETVRTHFDGGGHDIETELRYGTDVVDEIVAAAEEVDAEIAFVPRPSGRIKRLLSGNLTRKLVANDRVPVIVLPAAGERPE